MTREHLSANRKPTAFVALLLAWFGVGATAAPAAGPSFRNDVMPVLSKAGCNMGVCHGNKNGKGGFKLSLRGQDPGFDHQSLTREQFGRRIDRQSPEESLLLKKPTMGLAHEGGRRFSSDSFEYETLLNWISLGAVDDGGDAPRLERLDVSPQRVVVIEPQDQVQLRVEATFSDGRRLDVTDRAVYETQNQLVSVSHGGLVRRVGFGEATILARFLQLQAPVRVAFVPERKDFVWQEAPENNFIDRHVFAKLRSLRMNPSPLCDDHVFVRRAYLDLLGLPPTADEARRFVADPAPDKRRELTDRLLQRPEFADHWALKWSDLLRNEEKTLDRKGVQNFHHWIRQSIAEGKPLDRFARELIAARGSSYANPPANWYRANRDPISRAEATARVFLGTRLQCAKCHNHPFDRWTQDDYYGWAGFFGRVEYKILENNRRDRNDKHEFDGEQIVWMARSGAVDDPRNGQPAQPRYLGAATPRFSAEDDPLEALADWVTSRENGRFAKAQVNFIWHNLLGRGIVDPVDDFRATNPPVNPALLDALSDDFVRHGCKLRRTVGLIVNSRTYQLSSQPNETNRDDEANFSRALVLRLSAEQLLDAITQTLDAPAQLQRLPAGNPRRADSRRDGGAAARPGAKLRRHLPRAVRQAAAAVGLRVRTLGRDHVEPGVSTHQRPHDERLADPRRQPPGRHARARRLAAGDDRRTVLVGREPAAQRRRSRRGRGLLDRRERPSRGAGRHRLGLAERKRVYPAALTRWGVEHHAVTAGAKLPRFSPNLFAAGRHPDWRAGSLGALDARLVAGRAPQVVVRAGAAGEIGGVPLPVWRADPYRHV